MHITIHTQHTLNASFERLWEIVESGGKWEDWFPILSASTIDGHSRTCRMDNGDVLEETDVASKATKTVIYAVEKQQTFPAENIIAAMSFTPKTDSETELIWAVEMDVEDEATGSELEKQISQLYGISAKALETLALQSEGV